MDRFEGQSFPRLDGAALEVLVILVLAGLAVVGIEILRRQTAHEFPNASTAPDHTGTRKV